MSGVPDPGVTAPDVDPTTLDVADVQEITALIARLCHSLDFSRPEDFVGLFVPDGTFRAVSSTAGGETERFAHTGPVELLAFAQAAADKRQGLGRHWTGNLVLQGDGATASGVSYVLFVEIDPDTKERRIPISGVHRDTFRRTDEGWRFASRTILADI
jgi:hypothetical protein